MWRGRQPCRKTAQTSETGLLEVDKVEWEAWRCALSKFVQISMAAEPSQPSRRCKKGFRLRSLIDAHYAIEITDFLISELTAFLGASPCSRWFLKKRKPE